MIPLLPSNSLCLNHDFRASAISSTGGLDRTATTRCRRVPDAFGTPTIIHNQPTGAEATLDTGCQGHQ